MVAASECFLTLKKHVLEIQMAWNQKFSPKPAGEGLKSLPQTHQLSSDSLLSIYSGTCKV